MTFVGLPEALNMLLAGNDVLVVDFYTPNCVPCKILDPVFLKIAQSQEFKNVAFCKYDASNQEGIEHLNIKSVPAVVVFVKGVEADRHIGLTQQATLENLIRNVVNKYK